MYYMEHAVAAREEHMQTELQAAYGAMGFTSLKSGLGYPGK